MKRTTIFIDEAIEADLQALARRQQRPVAALVREAVEQYVVGQRRPRAARPGFVGVGRSGTTDTAERHEAMLFADLLTRTEDGAAKRARPAGAYPATRRKTRARR